MIMAEYFYKFVKTTTFSFRRIVSFLYARRKLSVITQERYVYGRRQEFFAGERDKKTFQVFFWNILNIGSPGNPTTPL